VSLSESFFTKIASLDVGTDLSETTRRDASWNRIFNVEINFIVSSIHTHIYIYIFFFILYTVLRVTDPNVLYGYLYLHRLLYYYWDFIGTRIIKSTTVTILRYVRYFYNSHFDKISTILHNKHANLERTISLWQVSDCNSCLSAATFAALHH